MTGAHENSPRGNLSVTSASLRADLSTQITNSSSLCEKAFDELVGLYEKVGQALPLLQQYESFFRTRPHKVKILVLIYKEITTFHQTALEYFRNLG